jgi:hypothetical protein
MLSCDDSARGLISLVFGPGLSIGGEPMALLLTNVRG